MAKEQKNKLWKRATDSTWKRVLIAACLILAIPLVGIGIAEFSYQARVNKLTTSLDQFSKSAGGVNEGTGISSHCTHSWDAFWAIDTGPCPLAGGTVWIAATLGEQSGLVTDLLKKEGYAVSSNSESTGQYSTASGTKDRVGINIETIVTDSNAPKQPLPEGKQWVRLNISVREVK